MKRILLFIHLCTLGLASCYASDSLTVVSDAASAYAILIDSNDPESVSEAAKELQRLVEKSSGVLLPITNEPTEGKMIIIGSAAQAYGVDASGLAHDNFYMKVTEEHIILSGKDGDITNGYRKIPANSHYQFYNLEKFRESLSAGSYYATIEFLREYIGVRWYMPTELGEEVPQLATIKCPAELDTLIKPFFKQRRMDFTEWNNNDVKKAISGHAYNKIENIDASLKWGRHLRHTHPVVMENGHGWRHWIPANVISNATIAKDAEIPSGGYGPLYPEYFALVSENRQTEYRSAAQHGGQLSVAYEPMIEQYANNIIKYREKNANVWQYSLAQNDGGTHCECELCTAWDPIPQDMKKPTDELFLTDRFLKFQKQVSDLVTAKYPDTHFMMTAYHETGRAPIRESVPDNFFVQGFYNYFPNRYYLDNKKQAFQEAVEGWGALTENYRFSSFYFAYGNHSLPWSTKEAQIWLIKTLADNGVQYFENIYGSQFPMIGQLGPDQWLVSQLVWNPEQDPELLLQDWYEGGFTPEIGALIRDYYETIEEEMAIESKKYTDFWNGRTKNQLKIDVDVLTRVRSKCDLLIKQAKELAKAQPERIQWRVKQVSDTWDFTVLTLDAQNASKLARSNPTDQNYSIAYTLGLQRDAMIYDPSKSFSISPQAVEVSESKASVGIIIEEVDFEQKTLSLPLVETIPDWDAGSLGAWMSQGASIGAGDHQFKDNKSTEPIEPAVSTTGSVFYDEDGIYVIISAKEPNMADLVVSADPSKPWQGDDIEVFFTPSGGTDEYFQFVVGPENDGVAISLLGDTGHDETYAPEWKHKTYKDDQSWAAQLYIPWKDLGGKPDKGDQWKANFYRTRQTGGGTPSYMAWSPTGSGFANPSMFGNITFSGSSVTLDIASRDTVSVTVYPNPSRKIIKFEGSDYFESKLDSVSIFAGDGAVMFSAKIKEMRRIDVSELKTGIYVVVFELSDGQRINRKVLIENN
ncbi:DUF4838 domain-containing protein [Reichenbachiella carrageenanivorans]|uniref:DUF4838 domain-containing protein n=1 Tax=Reichenbachiella carrageenanivorans TaxID=2979869 RepID=A0ABY6D5V9_9BACT|nr:DUF4838 domain-containing protein [Reichenbachiella carrageenanivorans]UXX80985.1 DUF4838 domain-containing protein [Reichenbachiella carrageenanivorans]